MATKYDVFYVIAKKGEVRIIDIVFALNKPKSEYNSVFNHIVELEKDGFIKRNGNVTILHNIKSEKLFSLISFCIRNSMNYNLLLKKQFADFIRKAAAKEFFSINGLKIHPQTFKLYISALSKYGFLLVISKKPLICKLLRHHFFMDLTEFFGIKLEFYTPKKISLIKNIKKELLKYKRNLKINYSILDEMEKKNEVNFIYSSLNLEGNPLTLPETQKLLLNDITPEKHTIQHIEEVTNYKKAVDLMHEKSRKKEKISPDAILLYHKIAMAEITGAGIIRKQNVIIKNNPEFKTSDWKDIPAKMNKLIKKYEEFESKKSVIEDIIAFASFFHNEFQRIHPFIDGNSRISRLLMFYILKSKGIPINDLPIGYFDLYLDLTKRSAKRDDESFKYLIEEIIFMNLKRINNTI